jgi:hypothetical protein
VRHPGSHDAHERRQQVQAVVGAIADEVEVVELHRTPLLDHGVVGPARSDPLGQLARVADGRRQADQLHVARRWMITSSHTGPAVRVLEEVHLVEHDDPESVERACRP